MSLLKLPSGEVGDEKATLNLLLDEHCPESDEDLETTRPTCYVPHKNVVRSFKWLTASVTKMAIMAFTNGKAPGPDQCPPDALKRLPDNYIEALTILFKAISCTGYVPRLLRHSRLIFLPKPGKPSYDVPRAYRPITLSSFFIKAYERINLWRCEQTFMLQNPLHKHQFAFQMNKSCEGALSLVTDTIEAGINRKHIVIGLFLDIKGAFDNVDHTKAVQALTKKGMPSWQVHWYEYYLRNRTVFAELNGVQVRRRIRKGTPQGGVLSPLIWNLIFDTLIRELLPPLMASIFADDLALLGSGVDQDAIRDRLQEALDKVSDWGRIQGLTFCPEKSVAIIFTRQDLATFVDPAPLILNGRALEYVNEVKYLGIWLDRSLSFQTHIRSKVDKCKKLLMTMRGFFTRFIRGPNPKLLKWAYTAIVLPTLTYGCHIWGHKVKGENANSKKLSSLQRSALLMITHAFPKAPTHGLEVMCHLPSLEHRLRKDSALKYLRTRSQFTRVWTGDCHSKYASKRGHIKANRLWLEENGLHHKKVDYSKTTLPLRRFSDLDTPAAINIYTDGSKKDNRVGYGYVRLSDNKRVAARLPDHCTVFQAEMQGILTATNDLILAKTKNQTITIHSDSESSIKALFSRAVESNQIKNTVYKLNHLAQYNTVNLNWVKAHVGTFGNEVADKLAKRGTEMTHISHPDLPLSPEILKSRIYKAMEEQWIRAWAKHPIHKYRQTKFWFPTPHAKNSDLLLKLERPQLHVLTQAITGFNNLCHHSKNKKVSKSRICRLCLTGQEDIVHLVTGCRKLKDLSEGIFGLNPTHTWTPPKLLSFIADPRVKRLMETRVLDAENPPVDPDPLQEEP